MVDYNLNTENKSIGGGIDELNKQTLKVFLDYDLDPMFSNKIKGSESGKFSELQFNRIKSYITNSI